MVVSIDGFTAARSQAIEDEAIIGGSVDGSGDLILEKNGGGTVNAGSVIGPSGADGSGLVICTSTTRPTASEGLAIWETNTNKFLIYNGVAWTPPWNSKWGHVGTPKIVNTQQNSITDEEDVTGSSFAFTAIANRIYKHTVRMLVGHDVEDFAIVIRIADVSGTELDRASCHPHAASSNDALLWSWLELGLSAGAHTRKVTAQSGAGATMYIDSDVSPFEYSIEDDGPNGNPA